MPTNKAKLRSSIHFSTGLHNIALPSSGKAEAVKRSKGFYLESSKSTSSASLGFNYSASSSCSKTKPCVDNQHAHRGQRNVVVAEDQVKFCVWFILMCQMVQAVICGGEKSLRQTFFTSVTRVWSAREPFVGFQVERLQQFLSLLHI